LCGEALSAQEKQHSIAPAVDTYRVHVGDVLEISIYQHPELSRRVVVRRDGNITLPLVNVLKVSGLSAMDLATLLRDKLEPVIPKPQVTVTVVIHTFPPVPPSPEPSLRDIPSQPPLPKPVERPSHQLRDVPSPESRQDCCVAREGL
jgi:Polysaccharide biosynthesis/export protein